MKQFPVYHAIIIAFLLACIFGVLQLVLNTPAPHIAEPSQSTSLKENAAKKLTSIEFRFSSKPRLIQLRDGENNLVFETDSPDFDNEHSVSDISIPVNENQLSYLKLSVEWDKPTETYHFFTMDLAENQHTKIGLTSVTDSINEDLTLQW